MSNQDREKGASRGTGAMDALQETSSRNRSHLQQLPSAHVGFPFSSGVRARVAVAAGDELGIAPAVDVAEKDKEYEITA